MSQSASARPLPGLSGGHADCRGGHHHIHLRGCSLPPPHTHHRLRVIGAVLGGAPLLCAKQGIWFRAGEGQGTSVGHIVPQLVPSTYIVTSDQQCTLLLSAIPRQGLPPPSHQGQVCGVKRAHPQRVLHPLGGGRRGGDEDHLQHVLAVQGAVDVLKQVLRNLQCGGGEGGSGGRGAGDVLRERKAASASPRMCGVCARGMCSNNAKICVCAQRMCSENAYKKGQSHECPIVRSDACMPAFRSCAHTSTKHGRPHGPCMHGAMDLAWHMHMHGCSHGTCTCMGARRALAYACMSHQALAYRPARSSHAYALHGPSNGPCTHAQALHGLSPMHMPCVAHAGLQACTPCMV